MLLKIFLLLGTVGAAPVQNIGAYGVEVCSFIIRVEVYDLQEKQFTFFANSEGFSGRF